MKTLPDNPHLDHLRRQAKDLLSGLRADRPGSTLSEAQALLADQYGFRSWPDLKAEVDRTHADTADPALARTIADRYDLGMVTAMRSSARPDDSGRRWELTTDRGRWSVRTLDTWHPIVDAETDTALQLAAAGAGIRLPAPVRSRTGAVIEEAGGHRWRVHAWLPSGPPLVAPADPAVTRAVGAILARLHGLALPVGRISPWHAYRLSKTAWPELTAAARARHAPWADDLDRAVPALQDLETLVTDAEPPAPVLTHNVLGPAAVRRAPDGALVVVDWHHAGGQPPAWELATALMDWTISSPRGAAALLDGYRTEAGALPALDPSSFRGAVTALANYVSGQVDQALTTDRRYAHRSVHHLLTHLPTRTALERLLP